ncbi:hypothetical protein EVAR_87870_1 [Eumeta japonica]|uniref:Uncharacterized protein n=1 Tax=Eumeta variegata TaxID=151549 RepID=A0A4C1WXF6_EUMVA|nr:hypothetical protein EVAR_87870_1 [Eumeta japonica]
MDSVFFQTSLFSRPSQCDGCDATVSDAPLPLHFIGGASVAHRERLYTAAGAVSRHVIDDLRGGGRRAVTQVLISPPNPPALHCGESPYAYFILI